jgi:hypothetical protein
MVIVFPQAVAQARYKHLPRVRIEKTTEEKPVVTEKINIPVAVENNITQEEFITPEVTEVAVVNPENVVLVPEKKAGNINLKTIEEQDPSKKTQDHKQAFSESVKKKSYLLEVKEVKTVKKTMIIGYLLWFFIVLLIGVAVFILAFVFLGIIAYSLYYIFLVFGILGLTIALLILIFGLTGVIA